MVWGKKVLGFLYPCQRCYSNSRAFGKFESNPFGFQELFSILLEHCSLSIQNKSVWEWVVSEGQDWGHKWNPFKGSQQEAHFVSKSISTNGRNEASVKMLMFPNESAMESGKELRLGPSRLQWISLASWIQSYKSPSFCSFWTCNRSPRLLFVSPF